MSDQHTPFCSTSCQAIELNRSVRPCKQCGARWNGQGGEASRNYCNSAWTICIDCATSQGRCVVCGAPAVASGERG